MEVFAAPLVLERIADLAASGGIQLQRLQVQIRESDFLKNQANSARFCDQSRHPLRAFPKSDNHLAVAHWPIRNARMQKCKNTKIPKCMDAGLELSILAFLHFAFRSAVRVGPNRSAIRLAPRIRLGSPVAALRCPECRSPNVNIVDSISHDSYVDYYRCDECGRVWIERKPAPKRSAASN